jgi:hypothetical protein
MKFIFGYTYNNGGLGDMIRGMVNVFCLSRIFQTHLNFQINHPIKEHFIYENYIKKENEHELIYDLVWSPKGESVEDLLYNLFNNKDNLIGKNIIIHSNISFYQTIKNYGNYKKLYNFAYKNIFEYFKPKEYLILKNKINYNIIHIRFGDAFLSEAIYCKEDVRNGSLTDIEENLHKVYEIFKDDSKNIIFSDNLDLLKSLKIPSRMIIDEKPSIHFGYSNTQNIDIVPTLQTFFEFKNCNKIIVNAYSGFSFLASLCFDKPYINFNNEPAKFKISSI